MTTLNPSDGDSLRAVVANRIRDDIIAGNLAPGSRLREEEIAHDYGASRLPVREALAQLQAEGFVEIVRFKGAAVAVPHPDSGLELLDVRRRLEGLAALRAAEARGGDAAAELRAVVELGREAVGAQEYMALPGLTTRFHELIAIGSGNAELRNLLAQLHSKMAWVFRMDLPERSADSWREHEEILGAILQGLPALASELMERHVARDADVYVSRMSPSQS